MKMSIPERVIIWIAIAFVIIAIIAMLSSHVGDATNDAIAILTLLVTLLVGWQIYNVVDLKKSINYSIIKSRRLNDDITRRIKQLEDDNKIYSKLLHGYKNDNSSRNHFFQASMYKLDSRIYQSKHQFNKAIEQRLYSIIEYGRMTSIYDEKAPIFEAIIDICDMLPKLLKNKEIDIKSITQCLKNNQELYDLGKKNYFIILLNLMLVVQMQIDNKEGDMNKDVMESIEKIEADVNRLQKAKDSNSFKE